MAIAKKSKRVCKNGHTFLKSSDCPVCPVCEKENKPQEGFLSLLGTPARRALQNKGITTLRRLASHSEKEILQMHGIGPSSLPTLKTVLKQAGLSFKK
jgi:predicted RecB family nuclease